MLADLGFYGNVGRNGQHMFPAYMIVAGAEIGNGKARLAKPIDRVSARDLPEFVHDVLKLWIEKKKNIPPLPHMWMTEGTQEIREIADRFREIPAYQRETNVTIQDWGAQGVLFSCRKRPWRVLGWTL